MQINLFGWIRQAVRQSVILGVADAIDDLGQPETKQNVSKALRKSAQELMTEEALAGKAKTAPRRLGRGLKDIDAASS